MIEIFDGKRYDISSDRTFTYRGTAEYLREIGATIDIDSGRKVPAADVNAGGKYVPTQPKGSDARRT
jgi:hypothetical protein